MGLMRRSAAIFLCSIAMQISLIVHHNIPSPVTTNTLAGTTMLLVFSNKFLLYILFKYGIFNIKIFYRESWCFVVILYVMKRLLVLEDFYVPKKQTGTVVLIMLILH